MLNRIPPALLVSRIGGMSLAHGVRKTCFVKEAPVFLREVAGILGVQGSVSVLPQSEKQSGVVTFTGETLRMQVFEDPGPQNGVQFVCYFLQPDGTEKSKHCKFLKELSKDDAWAYHVHALKNELGTRQLFH